MRFVAEQFATRVDDDSSNAIEIAIRLLERRGELNGFEPVLNSLLRMVGLFPYLLPESLSISDQLAFEAHRPLGMTDLVLHRVQGELYRRALAGENILLSAPTSFGKSLIVDALLASGRYDNSVVLVPTLALIDEVRRRLSRFSDTFKIITHPSQRPDERNVYVLTQERLLDLDTMPPLDLFIIDEFYKLDSRRDPERSSLLNSAFRRLWRTGAQFLLLGPNIENITPNLPEEFRATFFHTDFKTVAADVRQLRANKANERDLLIATLRELVGPTLLYCRSPNRSRQVATWLMEAQIGSSDSVLEPAIEWLSENYDPDWYVVRALKLGVGVHHGRLPRSLAHWMVRSFNEGSIQHLICTSTLIEGVNTRAKNVVVFDRTIAREAYDFFTFNNIRGRSGRMFHHFVGNVVLFHTPPEPTLPVLDIPAFTQSENADDALLIQLEPDELTEPSQARIREYYAQELLSLETLKGNHGIDPAAQLATARRILNNPNIAKALQWSGYPGYTELQTAGDLIIEYLKRQRGMAAGVASGKQLAYLLTKLSFAQGDTRPLIQDAKATEDSDAAVENALDFMRYWASHSFPRYLMALDSIQHEILPKMGLQPGNYQFYAQQVENLFSEPPLISLEEHGIPIQLARRLTPVLEPNGDLDELLERLASVEMSELQLSAFEHELLRDSLSHLG